MRRQLSIQKFFGYALLLLIVGCGDGDIPSVPSTTSDETILSKPPSQQTYNAVHSGDVSGTISGLKYSTGNGIVKLSNGSGSLTCTGDLATKLHDLCGYPGSGDVTISNGPLTLIHYTSGSSVISWFKFVNNSITYELRIGYPNSQYYPNNAGQLTNGSFPAPATITFGNQVFEIFKYTSRSGGSWIWAGANAATTHVSYTVNSSTP